MPKSGHIPPLPGEPSWIHHLAACGPLARSVADLRLCLKTIAGPDGRDLAVAPASLSELPRRPLEDYRFAWTDDFGGLPVSAGIRNAMGRLADDLANAGGQVEEAKPQDFDFDLVWRTYGELMGVMLAGHAPRLPRAVLRALGRFIFNKDVIAKAASQRATASIRGYYAVLAERDRLTQALERFLAEYDAWLCPVASTSAFLHRRMGKINGPIDVDGTEVPGHLGTIGYTCAFNLTGNPVVILPLGVPGDGLPIGVQVVGHRWGEMALLNVAQALTQITGPLRHPPARH